MKTFNLLSPPQNFGQYAKERFEQKALDSLTPKPYYERYVGVFRFCLLLAMMAQGFSLISEFGYFKDIVHLKISHTYGAFALTLLLVALLEVAKFYLINQLFLSLYGIVQRPLPYVLLIVCLLLGTVSIYSSVQGGEKLADDPEKLEQASNYLSGEVAIVREEIKDIQERNSWKGNTWLPKEEKNLLNNKEDYVRDLLEQKAKRLQEVKSEIQEGKRTYWYGFASFELIFWLSTWFSWYFRYRVAVESRLSNPLPASPDQQQETHDAIRPTDTVKNVKKTTVNGHAPLNQTVIGFQVGKEGHFQKASCAHCNAAFLKHTTWQKYCSEDCRKAAWEARKAKKTA